MIKLENLNNQSIAEILEDANRQISYLSSEWTNRQESDPGITLMELMVWLKWVQHEYLNRIAPGVKDKFLNLLDVNKQRNKGSKTLIEVSGLSKDVDVPRGTHWKAGNMIFRNLRKQRLISSQILSVEFNNPGIHMEEEYYKFDGKRIFSLFGEHFRIFDKDKTREFIMKFSSALPKNKKINFYFEIHINESLKRNPIEPGDYFEDMAKLAWEYYGISEDGTRGWHEIEMVSDETHNFLFSGIVRFKIPGVMESNNGVYEIRVRLLDQQYDFPPAITNIRLNVFRVVQGEIKCENLILKKEDISKGNTIIVETHMALYGEHSIYIRKRNGWVHVDEYTFERNLQKGEVSITINNLDKFLNGYKNEDKVVMIISYDPSLENKMILGNGTGTSYQSIEFREQNVLYDGMNILVGEEKGGENIFSIWRRVDDFFSSDKYDKHFIFNEKREVISFGDHILGMAPRKGISNIKLCRLETCMGERSNIRKGMIHSVETQNEELKKARILQITDATGGMDIETMDHAQARASNLFSKCGRAVTMDDYQNIVGSTPGLIFKNICILPNYINGKTATDQNCVTIAVRWNNKVNVKLPESYRRNIIKQVNKYRIINTKIDVIGPEYIGLSISGDIVVNSFYKKSEKKVEKQIKTFVNNLNNKFGQVLHYGDLFGMIDRLDYVSYLEKFKIVPKGKFIENEVSEDIFVPPNGIYYVDKIDLNYIRDSNI